MFLSVNHFAAAEIWNQSWQKTKEKKDSEEWKTRPREDKTTNTKLKITFLLQRSLPLFPTYYRSIPKQPCGQPSGKGFGSNKISTVHGTRLYCAFFFGAYFLAQRFTRAGREEKPINVIKLLSVVRRDHSHRARESVVPIEVVSVCVFFLRFGAAQPSTHFHLLSVRMGLLFIRRFRRIGGGRCVSVCCPE